MIGSPNSKISGLSGSSVHPSSVTSLMIKERMNIPNQLTLKDSGLLCPQLPLVRCGKNAILWVAAIFWAYLLAIQYHACYVTLLNNEMSDLRQHINFIPSIGTPRLPHPVFHYSTVWMAKLSGYSLQTASICVLFFYNALTAVGLFCVLRVYLRGVLELAAVLVLLCSLMQISGVWLPSFHERIFLGVGSPNVMHNPTTLVVKPFAIGVVLALVTGVQAKQILKAVGLIFIAAVLAVLSTYAKPNFAIAMLLAVPVIGSVFLITRKITVVRWMLMMCPVLATILVLSVQWVAQYNPQSPNGIALSPMTIATHYHKNPLLGAVQLMAFPLGVALVCPRIFKDTLFSTAFMIFVVALVQYFLLAETGPRHLDGNFGWGKDIASHAVFACALGYAVREVIVGGQRGNALLLSCIATLYVWHLWSGVNYFSRFGNALF
jgi:hypothetical protein